MKRWKYNTECKTCTYGCGWIVTLDEETKQYRRKRCTDDCHIQESS